MPFRFEGLQIWHQSIDFAEFVYQVVGSFPDQEKYSLTSQMTRAANSVSLNIAEGAGRDTDADFSRFLGIAVGSTFEVVSGSFIAERRGYITHERHQELYRSAEKLAKGINSFRQTLARKL